MRRQRGSVVDVVTNSRSRFHPDMGSVRPRVTKAGAEARGVRRPTAELAGQQAFDITINISPEDEERGEAALHPTQCADLIVAVARAPPAFYMLTLCCVSRDRLGCMQPTQFANWLVLHGKQAPGTSTDLMFALACAAKHEDKYWLHLLARLGLLKIDPDLAPDEPTQQQQQPAAGAPADAGPAAPRAPASAPKFRSGYLVNRLLTQVRHGALWIICGMQNHVSD